MTEKIKRVGREVNFIKTSEDNPRNGEGAFLRLKDGAIIYAYSRFTGGGRKDDGAADIAAVYSRDEGETWTEPSILIKHDKGSANFMCPSLMRMANGDIGLFYIRKSKPEESAIYLVRSDDEAKTFSEPVACTAEQGHYVVAVNDHAIRLKSGRIIMPLNHHSLLADPSAAMTGVGTMVCTASDDDGRTWKQICCPVHHPHEKFCTHGMQETMIYQFASGRLWALSRSEFGCQYQCFSDDNGESWSEVHPNTFFTSPPSPLLIKNTGLCTAAVWNPVPLYNTRDDSEPWGRTPLVMAVSEDDGKTFPRIYALEDDPKNGYCYPAIFGGKDYILVGYYHSDNTEIPLNANKIVKIMLDELELNK